MRLAANSEAMTKCNVIATSACLQSQRQWLSAMPLQPLLFSQSQLSVNKCNVIATCDDSETQRHRLSAMSMQPLPIHKPIGNDLVQCHCNLYSNRDLDSRHQIGLVGTRTSHLHSVSVTLCGPDHLVCFV